MPRPPQIFRGRAPRQPGARGVVVMTLALMTTVLPAPELHAKRAREPRPEQLLILPLEHELGADAERMRPVEQAFRDEAAALKRFRVLPRGQATTLLDSVRSLGLDCQPGDLECLTKAGVIMEIELLAVLRAAATEERVVVTAILIDVDIGRTRTTVSRTIRAGDSLSAVMKSAAVELLAPDLFVGGLDLDVVQEGATVRVDGAVRGSTPLAGAIGGLAPGEHVVSVAKPGFPTAERVVLVKALEDTSVVIDLRPAASHPAAGARAAEAAPSAERASLPSDQNASAPARAAALPVLPMVLGGVAAASVVAAVGAGLGALWMSTRFTDTALAPAERRDARMPGQLLVVTAVATGALAVIATGAAGSSALFGP